VTADPNDSAPAREYSGEDTQKIPVPDDGGTPPGEGQIPAHEPQDEPADSDTEAPDEERGN
jgi:hypothetical protein